jgi:hypothetical protein
MIVGVHGLTDETLRLHEYSPGFDPERFAAHEKFFVEDVRGWTESRFGVSLPTFAVPRRFPVLLWEPRSVLRFAAYLPHVRLPNTSLKTTDGREVPASRPGYSFGEEVFTFDASYGMERYVSIHGEFVFRQNK